MLRKLFWVLCDKVRPNYDELLDLQFFQFYAISADAILQMTIELKELKIAQLRSELGRTLVEIP